MPDMQARPEIASAAVGGMILSGPQSVRLDGADKGSVEIGGLTLLEHVLGALSSVAEVVVVGELVPTSRPVNFLREEPRDSGPAAALIAGLDGFAHPPEWVVTLAVDLPLVTTDTVSRLADALAADAQAERNPDGALLVSGGRKQFLCGIYRVSALRTSAHSCGNLVGLPMKKLLAPLDPVEVAAVGLEARDVDTHADIREVRELMGE